MNRFVFSKCFASHKMKRVPEFRTAHAQAGREECSSVIFHLASQPAELVKPKLIKPKGLQIRVY